MYYNIVSFEGGLGDDPSVLKANILIYLSSGYLILDFFKASREGFYRLIIHLNLATSARVISRLACHHHKILNTVFLIDLSYQVRR